MWCQGGREGGGVGGGGGGGGRGEIDSFISSRFFCPLLPSRVSMATPQRAVRAVCESCVLIAPRGGDDVSLAQCKRKLVERKKKYICFLRRVCQPVGIPQACEYGGVRVCARARCWW